MRIRDGSSDVCSSDLGGAALGLVVLVVLKRRGVAARWLYAVPGALLGLLRLKSGVHATLAGVMLALTVPLRTRDDNDRADRASPLHRLEHGLHPWVAFLIIPIFGFANAGVSFAGMNLQTLMQPVPLGIADRKSTRLNSSH